MAQKKKKSLHRLKQILHQHRERAYQRLHRRHRHLKRIIKKHWLKLADIRQKGAKVAAAGAVASMLLTSSGSVGTAKAQAEDGEQKASDEEKRRAEQRKKLIAKVITRFGPKDVISSDDSQVNIDTEVKALFNDPKVQQQIKDIAQKADYNATSHYESDLSTLFKIQYGIDAQASLDGQRLNTTFGAIGAEQHLPRYPGDSVEQHADDRELRAAGITPRRGAWGYWTSSKKALTDEQIQQEQWYIAAQTFLAPGWRHETQKLYNWFKYRKVLVVNPRNGKAVVAVIGDSGPATWTGKSFGGSPEVMRALDAHDGRGIRDINTGGGGAKDRVFVFFVNDPENSVPLGPIDTNKIELAKT